MQFKIALTDLSLTGTLTLSLVGGGTPTNRQLRTDGSARLRTDGSKMLRTA